MPDTPGPVAWLPTPGDDLLPVLWSLPQARTVHEALCATRDQWMQAAADAQAASELPQQPRPALSDQITVEPTPAGYRNLARIADANAAACARLADRLHSIIDAATGHAGHNGAVVR
jgi:hypothetical protein